MTADLRSWTLARHAVAAWTAMLLLGFGSIPAAAYPRFVTSFLGYVAPFSATAVAVADLDGDGYPDAVLPNSDGTLWVYRGAGDGSLEPAMAWPAAAGMFVALGDLDGDGVPDGVVKGDSLAIAVVLGDGHGGFGAPQKFPCAKAPVMAVLGHLDAGPTLDAVTVNQASGTISIFLGNGDGTFAPRTDILVGGYPTQVAIADLDGDGDADLAVVNGSPGAIQVYLGDGLGHFTAGPSTATVASPARVAIGDLDHDGHPDLVVVGAVVGVQLGLGGGSFGPPTTVPISGTVSRIALADLDMDGDLDLVANSYYGNGVFTLLGRGDGTFESPRFCQTPRAPIDLQVVDMDRGGKLDVVALAGLGWMSVLFGRGDGSLGGLEERATGQYPAHIATADLDGDGHADVVTSNMLANTVSVLLGAGDGSFPSRADFGTGQSPRGLAIADLNGDGHPDLVVANSGPGTQTSSTVSVLLGDGAGGFGPKTDFTVGRWARSVGVGDFNGDGRPDLAVAVGDQKVTILDGVGDGTFVNRRDLPVGGDAGGLAIGDATGDGLLDVAVACTFTGDPLVVLPGLGNGTFGTPIVLGTSPASSVLITDYTRDGIADVMAAGRGGAIRVFPGLGGGAFGPPVTYAAFGEDFSIADLDGDGLPDAATANDWNSNTVSVLLQQGDGSLGGRIDYGAGDGPGSLVVADVNEDGRKDLVIANAQSSTISVVLNTGGEAWAPWIASVPPAAPTALGLRLRPNPAVRDLGIEFSLPVAANVTVRIYDVTGRLMGQVVQGALAAGPHSLRYQLPAGTPSGVAFVELAAGTRRAVRRAILLR